MEMIEVVILDLNLKKQMLRIELESLVNKKPKKEIIRKINKVLKKIAINEQSTLILSGMVTEIIQSK